MLQDPDLYRSTLHDSVLWPMGVWFLVAFANSGVAQPVGLVRVSQFSFVSQAITHPAASMPRLGSGIGGCC